MFWRRATERPLFIGLNEQEEPNAPFSIWEIRAYVRYGDADAFRFCRWPNAFSDDELVIEDYSDATEQDDSTIFEGNLPEVEESQRISIALTYDFPPIVEPFLELVDSQAVRVDGQHMIGASAYLYDFQASQE